MYGGTFDEIRHLLVEAGRTKQKDLNNLCSFWAVTLYNSGDFLTELNLEDFIAMSPAWAQSPSLHQQSGLGTLQQGHV